ncbi:MAG: 50S ribosomal protein L11 methyltransferase [Thermoanaerobaculia bacterium]
MLDYHRTLLGDAARMHALRAAVARVVRRDDIVLDLGSGTGILAFLACEAGARRVYAIEREHLADVASFLARHLRLDDRITILHDTSTNIELTERCDVLLTETIGAAGLDENILGYVLDAKKRFLRDGATIVPRSMSLHAAPIDADDAHQRIVGFWSDPNIGFDLSPLRVFASNALALIEIGDDRHIADDAELVRIDFATFESTLINGHGDFVASRDGHVHGFKLWFRATLADDIEITNREPKATSWAQAFLPLEKAVGVSRGTRIALELQTDDGKTWRWRGSVGEEPFDQMTVLNRPPCLRHD